MGKWIDKAIKHPGREKRAAARAGESTHAYMEQHKDAGGSAGAAARLGLRLEGMADGGMVGGTAPSEGIVIEHGPEPQQKPKGLSEMAKAMFSLRCRGRLARPGE